MSIDTVTTLTTISADLFNEVATTATMVMTDYYGVTNLETIPVKLAGDDIVLDDWLLVQDYVDRCLFHQTNTGSGIVLYPKIWAGQINQLVNATNQIWDDKDNVNPRQIAQITTSSTKTTTWNVTQTLGLSLTFTDAQEAQTFFRQGGKIDAGKITYSQSTSTPGDLAWIEIFDNFTDDQDWKDFEFTLTTYTILSNAAYIEKKTITNDATLKLRYTKVDGKQVDVLYTLIPDSPAISCSIDVTITPRVYFSAPKIPGRASGIGGIKPALSPFSGTWGSAGGGFIPPVITLEFATSSTNSLSSPLEYASFEQTTFSENKTIWLTNTGNSPVTVNSISSTQVGGMTPTFDLGGLGNKTIPAGQSRYFKLRYYTANTGTNANTITVNHQGTNTPLIGYVRTVTTASPLPPYTISLTPSVLTTTSNRLTPTYYRTVITETNGFHPQLPYVTLSTPTPFSISGIQNDSVTLMFDTALCPSSAVYSTVMTVATTSSLNQTALATKTFTVDYTKPLSQNLGSWLSPTQSDNGIIGMSYDIIADEKYLTIGIGMGDGNSNVQGGGAAQASLPNLGITADSKYDRGPVLYEPTPGAGWSSLLTNYGAWVRPTAQPTGIYVQRTYYITFRYAATFIWQFSVDEVGYFKIDGQSFGNVGIANPWAVIQTGEVIINSGLRKIELWVKNTSASAGVALRLVRKDTGEEVWNTRYPVRNEPSPYAYWLEVYRIKLSNTPSTYRSINYLIKDYSPVTESGYGMRYGDFFGAAGTSLYQSMFLVTNDGFGNLNIAINPKLRSPSSASDNTTLNYLSELYYYYSERAERLTNLDTGPIGDGSQTKVFTGFNASGQVQTRLAAFPTTVTPPSDGIGGGDTGDSGDAPGDAPGDSGDSGAGDGDSGDGY